MAQATPSTGSPSARRPAENDVYTVLAIVAFVAVLGAIAFALYRSNELLGTAFPGFA